MSSHQPFDESVDAAVEVYHLERSLHDLDEQALGTAISAANRKHEEIVITHIAEILENIADDVRGHFKTQEVDGRIALKYAANKIKKELPRRTVTSNYTPQPGDRVEVIVIGDVTLEEEECANCGEPHDSYMWCVTTDSGREHFFSKKDIGLSRVRVILRDVNTDEDEGDDEVPAT